MIEKREEARIEHYPGGLAVAPPDPRSCVLLNMAGLRYLAGSIRIARKSFTFVRVGPVTT
jgi:hypothetical protein